eukprot:gene19736-25838_t
MLPLLSPCDPRHDVCDAAKDLYCDPDEYECRYVVTTKPSNLDALDTSSTTTTPTVRTVAPAPGSTSAQGNAPTTTPNPSDNSKKKASSAMKMVYWCIGAVLTGVLLGGAGLAARRGSCFGRRAGNGGDHRYQNR